MERPVLDKNLNAPIFKNFYYLKEELVCFCKQEGLQATGSKEDLTERIYCYLDTGKKIEKKKMSKPSSPLKTITLHTEIEENFVCTEIHRAFYKEHIPTFSFLVPFQKWLKSNAGKTYQDSINAYFQILEEKKKNKGEIDAQFEYNTYIRDFFKDNQDKTLKEAIDCWKYKKSLPGHHRYEREDLHSLIQ